MSQKQSPTSHYTPRYWPAWISIAVLRLTCYLPRRWRLTLGKRLGHLFVRIVPKRRHIAKVNLQACFPNWSAEEQAKVLKASTESIGIGILETALAWWGNRRQTANMMEIRGLENYEAAIAQGGVLILGAHLATIDLAGRLFSEEHNLSVVYRPLKNPIFDEILKKKREKMFVSSIDRLDTKGFIRALRRGEAVWYAPDQDYGRFHSIFVPFFGIKAATITGTSRIAKMTGAAVVPSFQYRKADGTYLVEFLPALQNFPSDDEYIDTLRINNVIEQAILKHPEQYLWQHRRFKTRPEGEAELY